MNQTLKINKDVEIIELSVPVPQDQVNHLKQMFMKYVLDNNDQEVAMKLIESSNTKLREDLFV